MQLYDDDDDDDDDDADDDADDDDDDFPVRPLPRSVNILFDTFSNFFMAGPPPEV